MDKLRKVDASAPPAGPAAGSSSTSSKAGKSTGKENVTPNVTEISIQLQSLLNLPSTSDGGGGGGVPKQSNKKEVEGQVLGPVNEDVGGKLLVDGGALISRKEMKETGEGNV
jgi:hypothetical protein